ncbi:hypothetical protein OE88DRAFT_1734395 [Heliocybe sulcata]|uniref:DUF6699 domain-containing protein n=1 Tax=Heliocybe sulcata TaxID=5364 RepID=A0A5C3N535_9AGAM|nr:hypothetical protein OE88DRAFT_1734395 [Heliocybe sulcata]
MFKKLKKSFIDADPDAPRMGTVPLPEVEDVVVMAAVQSSPSRPKWRDECLSDGELMTRPRKPSTVRSSTPAPTPPPKMVQARSSTPAPRSSTPASRSSTPTRRSSTPAAKPPKGADSSPPSAAPKASSHACTVKNLHWLLLPYDLRISKGYLEYDFAHPVDRVRLRSPRGDTRPLTAADLHKPAADTPLVEMTIVCADLPQWQVRVRRPEGVRIVDVLDGIHRTYAAPLSAADKEALGTEKIEQCEGAFRRRCRAACALDEWEREQGIRRVDMLRGKTMFLGLIRHPQSGIAGDVWMLYLGKARDHDTRYASGRPGH